MKQKIRIEIDVDTQPAVPINEFIDKFVDANKKVLDEIAAKTDSKYELTAPMGVDISTNSSRKWHNPPEPTFFWDV